MEIFNCQEIFVHHQNYLVEIEGAKNYQGSRKDIFYTTICGVCQCQLGLQQNRQIIAKLEELRSSRSIGEEFWSPPPPYCTKDKMASCLDNSILSNYHHNHSICSDNLIKGH